MKKTTTIKIHANRILELKLLEDGTYDVLLEVEEEEKESESATNDTKPVFSESDFVLIEAESLSMDDEFMQYVPKNEEEEETKKLISEAIQKEVRNFYKPRRDMTFVFDNCTGTLVDANEVREGSPYVARYRYSDIEAVAYKFMIEHSSRLGSKFEYGAYLGNLIKKLVEEGETVEWAWDMVVNNSEMLYRHYIKNNSIVNMERPRFADIYGICEKKDSYKILAWDKDDNAYWMAGLQTRGSRKFFRLTNLKIGKNKRNTEYGIPWLVFS